MRCPSCHDNVDPSDRYCTNCGADVASLAEDRAAALDTASTGGDTAGALAAAVGGASRGWIKLVVVHLTLFVVSAVVVYLVLDARTRPAAPSPVSLGQPRLVHPGQPALEPAADHERRPGDRARAVEPGKPAAPRRRSGRTPDRIAAVAPTPGSPDAATSAAAPVPLEGHDPPTPGAPARGEPAAKEQPPPVTPGKAAPKKEATAPPPKKPAPPGEALKPGSAEQWRVSLNVGSVQLVVRHHLPQLRPCYARAQKKVAGVRGVVEVQFSVNKSGQVASATVHRNSTGQSELGQCIINKLKKWRFPRPVGGEMTFIYPFKIRGSSW